MDSGFTKAQDVRAGGFWCICTEWGGSMRKLRRAALMALLVVGFVGTGANPASAGTTRVSGTAAFDPGSACPEPVAPFDDYPALDVSGSLEGCWYTDVLWSKDFGHPGLYLEVGQELFVGTVNGESGSFTTKYVFEAKLGADGLEVSGQCQHPIVRGSGTDELRGIGGLILFTDIVTPTEITYVYRGVVSL